MTGLTMDEADAYLAGVADAGRELRRMARRVRAHGKGCPIADSNASTLEIAADALAEIKAPASLLADGLCGRGA